MTRSSVVLGLGALALFSPIVSANHAATFATSPQNPPATQQTAQNQTPPKSTALIFGQVIDGSTGEPVPEVIVTLRQSGGARGAGAARGAAPGDQAAAIAMAQAQMLLGRGGPQEQRLMTGGDGRFIFHSLAPGSYSISATASGYSSSLAQSASSTAAIMAVAGLNIPGSSVNSSSTLQLTEGQQLLDYRIRLWKQGAITGTVLDDGGEPAVGLMVQLMSRIVIAGRARYLPMGGGRTDDRGMYRIASIQPGDYIVVIPQAPAAVPAGLMESMMKGVLGGGDLSSVMGVADLAASGVNIGAAMQGGVRLGNYMVASASGAPPILSADGRLFVYQTAFYPGVAVPVQAEVITLKSGEERGGVNFQLRLTPTVRISGTATGPTGPMANLGMKLVVPADGVTSESEFDVATVVTAGDGSFTFFGVPPGQFLLRAQKEARSTDMAAAMAMMGMGRGSSPPGPAKSVFGQASISVASTDIDGVVLQLAEGATVSGRVEFVSSGGRGQPPPTTLQVQLVPADGRTPLRSNNPRVAANGTFETANYGPGKYFVQVQGVPAAWAVKAATIGGRDVLDAPLDLKDSSITGLLVTIADERFSLGGHVTATGAQKAGDAMVYVFPADHRSWIENGMNPRRSGMARPNTTGVYSITLPAGDYVAVAVDRADEGNLQDPAFIEALSRLGTRVSVVSAQQTLDLTTMKVKR